jgi:4,5-dihydroxyphthalate decarboxylase
MRIVIASYDRVRPLIHGEVGAEGLKLIFEEPGTIPATELLEKKAVSACELSMYDYLTALDQGNGSFTAIPVFPSRRFFHGDIYVRVHADIAQPFDLRGKRIGIANNRNIGIVWIKGILKHEYGINPNEIHWLDLEDEAGKSPETMLAKGEIDAWITSVCRPGQGLARRLFANYKREEQAFFQKTGIFPITHTLVVRNDILQNHPWVAQNLVKAFEEAKRKCMAEIAGSGAPKAAHPWLVSAVEETKRIMGEDYWPYGLEKNRQVLQTLVAWAYEQGVIGKQVVVEELFFAPTVYPFAG